MPATPKSLTVLVIDDDSLMTEILAVILGMEGHHVVTAESGEAGLEALPQQTVDVVLTDMQLPGLRGEALAERLRSALASQATSARLIGMSGSEPAAADRAAFDGFLLKPFSAEDFSAIVQNAGPPQQDVTKSEPKKTEIAALDESIVSRLATQLPAAKLRELYELTLQDARKRIDTMQRAETAGDFDLVEREAHALKGGTGMVGATELHQMAAQREKCPNADTPPLADFLAACSRLERMLDTRFNDTK